MKIQNHRIKAACSLDPPGLSPLPAWTVRSGDAGSIQESETAMMQARAPSWHPLSCVDEYLLSRGWTHNGVGWLAPASIQESIQIRYGGGGGAHSRAIAVSLQVSVDEFYLHEASTRLAPPQESE